MLQVFFKHIACRWFIWNSHPDNLAEESTFNHKQLTFPYNRFRYGSVIDSKVDTDIAIDEDNRKL